jgi:hypothetical protein
MLEVVWRGVRWMMVGGLDCGIGDLLGLDSGLRARRHLDSLVGGYLGSDLGRGHRFRGVSR